MASPRKSPQHQGAHGPSPSPDLEAINKIDIASFVSGVISTAPTGSPYYNYHFESPEHTSFYYIMEGTRRVNTAVRIYQGRKTEIRKARFSNNIVQDIYKAGVMHGGKFKENLRQAIHEACSHPTYQKELFEKAWRLYSEQVPYKHHPLIIIKESEPDRDATISEVHFKLEAPHGGDGLPVGGDGLPESNFPPDLLAAMRATKLKRVEPGETIVKELIHHSLLDIETGMVMRDRQILRAGMVVTSLAARLYRGRTDIFQRQTESYTGPLMAFIMDMSGSMSATWPRALAVMGAVAHTLNRAGAATICIGFASDGDHNFLYQFQDVNEAFDIDRFHAFRPPSGNADAAAVEYCRRQLQNMEQESREPKKKYIIMFSDEQPCGMTYRSSNNTTKDGNDYRTLNEALALCRTSNIITISALARRDINEGISYNARMFTSDPETTMHRLMEKMGVL